MGHKIGIRGLLCMTVCMVVGMSMVAEAQWTWTPQTKRWINLKRMPKETAELQYEQARSLLQQGKTGKALSETSRFMDYYKNSDFADKNQFLRGEIYLAEKKYSQAAKEFQEVIKKYPGTALYDQVIAKQYEIGDKLFELGQAKAKRWWPVFRKRPYQKAIKVYDMVIQNQPFTDAAAEAQYKVGLCHHMRKEHVEAASEYRRVLEDYAGSKWVVEAAYQLALCYYQGSLKAEYDQSPSLLAIEAIKDFSERFPSDPRVAELQEKGRQMHETVALQRLQAAQYYEKRNEFSAARTSYQAVADQYADTSSGQVAKAWMEKNPSTKKVVPEDLTGKLEK